MAGESKEVARAHLADAGVEELPDDWDVVTLGDLFTEDRGIAVGVMYPGDHDPDGVPLIKAGDLNGSIINPQPDFRISKDKHHEYRRTALEGGELLMTLVGNVGQCAVVPPRMAGWNTARAVAVMRLADSSETHFVQQCLLSRPLQHLMDVWCNTTVQATLNLKEIRQLPLPWPPKKSRDAIAAFGKALDDKIELNRRMNATLEAMARALLQSWFVDFDPVRRNLDFTRSRGERGEKEKKFQPASFPLRASAFPLDPFDALFPDSFLDSEAGHIPKGWTIQPVGEVVDCVGGGTPSTAEPKYWEGGTHHWTTPKDFSSLQAPVLLDTDRKLTDAGIAKISSGLLPAGTLLLSSRAPVGYLAIAAMPVAINQGFIAMKCNGRASNFFMLNWCQTNMAEIESRATGTTFAEISKQNFRPIRVVLPPKELMAAFTAKVAPLYAQITANLHQSSTLATLRDTLLPKLLSGDFSVAETLTT